MLKTKPKITFAGTPEIAAIHLQALVDAEYDIIAVYTQPDRPAGRGRKLHMSPVKVLAEEHSIKVYQPQSLRDETAAAQLQALHADLMIVVAYGLILPTTILNAPTHGCINMHASLLPRWRGAAPIQRAILAGDKQSGISIMQMDAGLDTGPVYTMATCDIKPTDTSEDLHDAIAALGAKTLVETIPQIIDGSLQATPQEDSQATYADKINKAEAEINWQQSAEAVNQGIRAFNPWPVAHTQLGDQTVRVWQAEVISDDNSADPGTILNFDKHGIDVATTKEVLRITRLQLPGGKALIVSDIFNSRKALFETHNTFGQHSEKS